MPALSTPHVHLRGAAQSTLHKEALHGLSDKVDLLAYKMSAMPNMRLPIIAFGVVGAVLTFVAIVVAIMQYRLQRHRRSCHEQEGNRLRVAS